MKRESFFIGSRWAKAQGPDTFDVVSPTSEQVVGSVPVAIGADIDAAVTVARKAFDHGDWPRLSFEERAAVLVRMGELLAPRMDEVTRVQVDEMGGPYSWLELVSSMFVDNIGSVAKQAATIPLREVRPGDVGDVLVTRDPIGVVAGIVPWNAPITLLLMKLVPALMAGCPIILKPAPESPLSAYLLADAAVEAGLPQGLLSIIPGGREIGEHLITHPGIDRVTFTGSTASGARVAALCGKHLKSVTLELGGKSAAILLDDADLDKDLDSLVAGSLANTGQMCFGTTRILVPRSRSAELVQRMSDAINELPIGDPHDKETFFGPLVAERQRDRVEGYIRSGVEQGAVVALGGGRPSDQRTGWFVEPTIFTQVKNEMKIAQEEIFGPVVAVIDYDTDEEAIAIANDSKYGLGGAVYTTDIDRGIAVATQVESGSLAINDAPHGGGGGPFGGIKQSGLGRERSTEGHQSYYTLKSIAVPTGYAVKN